MLHVAYVSATALPWLIFPLKVVWLVLMSANMMSSFLFTPGQINTSVHANTGTTNRLPFVSLCTTVLSVHTLVIGAVTDTHAAKTMTWL